MKIGAQGQEGLHAQLDTVAISEVRASLERLNDLARIALTFAFDLGGGPDAFHDHGFLSGKKYKSLVDARIRADVLLRGIYLKNSEKFIQDGYALSDVILAATEIRTAMREALSAYGIPSRIPSRKKIVVPEATLARVRAALGQ